MRTFKAAALAAALALVAGVTPVAAQGVSFELWTKEGEADGSLQWVQKLAADYTAAHPDVTINVVQKEVGGSESLRIDFQNQSFAGNPPALLWTVADHLGPFTAADLLLQTDDLIDNSLYVEGGVAAMQTPDGATYGVPINVGNHLMLYYNKDMVAECPADSDAMIEVAKANSDAEAGKYGVVYRQDESFWLVPFLGGFGGRVFADDGITPTLDTEAMANALTFMNDLEFVHGVMPVEADYQIADDLFKSGSAAMTINGDWTLGSYAELPFEDRRLPHPDHRRSRGSQALCGRQLLHDLEGRRRRPCAAGGGRRLHQVRHEHRRPGRAARDPQAAAQQPRGARGPERHRRPAAGRLGGGDAERHPATHQPGDALRLRRHEHRRPRQRGER